MIAVLIIICAILSLEKMIVIGVFMIVLHCFSVVLEVVGIRSMDLINDPFILLVYAWRHASTSDIFAHFYI